MQKNLIKIFIIILLLAPTISQAGFMAVTSGEATAITTTSATLNGYGGDSDTTVTAPVTGYFRYSSQPIAPIFCNDIYGTNMVSTGDLYLGTDGIWKSFSQKIYNLTPDTTYYYCAIISNKDNIAYGSESKVRQFHTNCYNTTINTIAATNIQSSSATLKGSYCSTQASVKTSFEYREANPSQAALPWKKVGETTHNKGNASNVYGNIQFFLSGLKANTAYQFKAVAVDQSTGAGGLTGAPLTFLTLPVGTSGGGSTRNDTGTGSTTNGGNFGGTVTTGGGPNNGTNGSGFGNGNNSGGGNNSNNNGRVNTIDANGQLNQNSQSTLQLGQFATPPDLSIVRSREGIETVLARQIVANSAFASTYGYQPGANLGVFAGDLAHTFAQMFGYVNTSGREIRVSLPDVAAYQLVSSGRQLTIYEYYYGKIVDIRIITTTFKNASGYEYYFNK